MRTSAEIDCGGREGFVHRHQEISGTQNAAFRAERFLDGFAERDANVFDGVVLIDVEVAFRGDGEIECTVARDEVEHVVEKANAGGDLDLPRPSRLRRKLDLGFGGLAMNGGGAAS